MNAYSSRLMHSKSWPSSFQYRSSSKQLGRRSDPGTYGLDGRKTVSKRSSEDSLEGCSKRSRTSQSPEGRFSQALSRPASNDSYTTAPDNTEYQSLPGPRDKAASGTVEKKTSSKRSSTDEENEEQPKKRSRRTPSPAKDLPSSDAGPSCQNTPDAPSIDQPSTSSTPDSFPRHSRAAFEDKYQEDKNNILGVGGFGSIYAGHRKEDNLPVAIKCLPQFAVYRVSTYIDGHLQKDVPLEVALLLRLKPEAGETSAVVALLDWYDLDSKLILVLERPIPCTDLINYVRSRRFALPEIEVKNIARQLVDVLIEIHSKGVFHGDIKLDNILIETGCKVPRIWIIDFGCGELLSSDIFTEEQGTYLYTSPEWFTNGWYRAEPATVWQLGVTLFGALHNHFPFENIFEMVNENPDISESLSLDCQSFLQSCLVKAPEARSTLEELKNHPWLM